MRIWFLPHAAHAAAWCTVCQVCGVGSYAAVLLGALLRPAVEPTSLGAKCMHSAGASTGQQGQGLWILTDLLNEEAVLYCKRSRGLFTACWWCRACSAAWMDQEVIKLSNAHRDANIQIISFYQHRLYCLIDSPAELGLGKSYG